MMVTAMTALCGQDMGGICEQIHAEPLVASWLQPSQLPTAEQVRCAVTETLRRFGSRRCAAVLAGEFGDSPQLAATRMTWALATVRIAYPGLDTATSAVPAVGQH